LITSGSQPRLGCNGFLAVWEDEAALAAYLASSEAKYWESGWRAGCEAVRGSGSWAGFGDDVPRAEVAGDDPIIGISIGTLRKSRGIPFNMLNTKIEEQFLAAGFDPSLPEGTKFFKEDANFMTLRPLSVSGQLSGKNPLAKDVFGSLA
jgi:hypothetical protein